MITLFLFPDQCSDYGRQDMKEWCGSPYLFFEFTQNIRPGDPEGVTGQLSAKRRAFSPRLRARRDFLH
jgi:hypothetical protein